MNAPHGPRACLRQALLALRLNLRSPQALLYGYAVPVLFLLAFGAVFRGAVPPLRSEMAQLLTLTLLGGACFGLPTTLVAEREQGVWRRYRLLPVQPAWLLLGSLLARLLLLAGACLLQLVLAALLFGTPPPQNPCLLFVAFLVCSTSFLGLGLLVAALADGIPSVQAIGQCLFLPMLMIGGVGIPLGLLPDWAHLLSGFMPGRYAVALLNAGYNDALGLYPLAFPVLALALIGFAAALAGLRLFRWDSRPVRRARQWLRCSPALLAWGLVGAAAWWTGRLAPEALLEEGLEQLSPALLAEISVDNLPSDNGLVTRLATPFPRGHVPASLAPYVEKLGHWAPREGSRPLHRIRRLLSAASLADLARHPQEAELARLIFTQLQQDYATEDLSRALGWLILHPDDGEVPTEVPELGLHARLDPVLVRERNVFYAKKLLGRLLGKLRDTGA